VQQIVVLFHDTWWPEDESTKHPSIARISVFNDQEVEQVGGLLDFDFQLASIRTEEAPVDDRDGDTSREVFVFWENS